MEITGGKGLKKINTTTGNVDTFKHVPQPASRTKGSNNQMSGKPRRTQEGQAQYVGFNIPPYCHIEMGCKSCLQHLMRFKPFLHFSFSCSSIRTDCHFIFGFFGFPFHSCFGLMFIPFKYMQHSLQFLCIQTLLENQTK